MPLQFSPEAAQRIAETRRQYPNSMAACLPVLHIAQDEFDYLSDEALQLVAATLDLPRAHVFGVATFYTMYHREPVGKHVLMMCTNVSCMLTGAYRTLHKLEERLGVKAGHTTPDGEFTLIEEECLAACADGPALICGERYFLRLTEDKVEQALDEIRRMPPGHGPRLSSPSGPGAKKIL